MKIKNIQLLIRSLKGAVAALEAEYEEKKINIASDFKFKEKEEEANVNSQSD